MRVIGITGGVGCGKSTVLGLLKEHFNAYIIMADAVAHQLMEPGQAGYQQTVEMFGSGILQENGAIDRKKLADIVFQNPNKRIVLNSIIHPLVKKEIVNTITNLRIEGKYAYVFVEAALLIEDHYNVICDELWYIYAPQKLRCKRLMDSRGYSQEKIDSIMRSQLSESEFRQACSQVIDNGKSLEDTLSQLVKLL